MNPPAGEPIPGAVGFVLAGGRSSRMGRDKALLPFAGRPLVAHALNILRQAGLETSIAGPTSVFADLAPVIEDSEAGLGPLGGICAALASISAQWAVFLPVDMPLVPASLVAWMVRHARITGSLVTLPSVNGFAQTFPAVLDRAVLPTLEFDLKAGSGGCFSAFQAAAISLGRSMAGLPVELLLQSGRVAHPDGLPASRWFLNVNAPADLRRAEVIQARIA